MSTIVQAYTHLRENWPRQSNYATVQSFWSFSYGTTCGKKTTYVNVSVNTPETYN